MQHTSDLRMDLLVDTSEQRALFVLQNFLFVKGSISSVPLYLFIYPESIHSIEFDGGTRPPTLGMEERSNHFIRLRFTLSQSPTFVFAKDRRLDPKSKSQGRLDVMKALAAVRVFDFYLDKLRLGLEMRSQLALLPSVFSSTSVYDRPKTDAHRGSLHRLYAGAGGQILDLGTAAPVSSTSASNTTIQQPVQQTIEEVVAPPYTKDETLQSPAQVITPSDRKRRRTSESLSPSTADKRILTAFAQLAKRHADLQSRVAHLEKMIADSRCEHTPCRYGTEEMENILGHVDDKIDNDMDNVRWELEDKVFDETRELVAEKTEEQQSQWWADMREGLMDEMRHEIKEELKAELRQELAAEIKRELFKDMAQAMMRAACGNGEKSGVGMSQSTQSTDSTQ